MTSGSGGPSPAVGRSGTSTEILNRLAPSGMRLGLTPIRRVLRRLGGEEPPMPVVHVAGTNGKGSTALLFASLATGTGARVGLYTSPHLETAHERLRIDGRAISEGRFLDTLNAVLDAADGDELTYFEVLTAAAILWFCQERVDLIVAEVGLGGRLDATNALPGAMALITAIDLDHTEWLGSSLQEIAIEKAGVFRAGRPALSTKQQVEAGLALADQARRRGTRLEVVSELPAGLEVPLAGHHQRKNAELAWGGASRLNELGLCIPTLEQAARAWARCGHPGRLEIVALPSGGEVVLDGAHNRAAVEGLAAWLGEAPYSLLFGVLRDKDYREMLAILAPKARRIGLTEPPTDRARPVEDLLTVLNRETWCVARDPMAALDRMLPDSDGRLVVAGSLFLIGAVRVALSRRFGVPEPAAALSLW